MYMQRRLLNANLVYLVFAVLLVVLPAPARQDSTFKLNVDVDLTELHVTVTDDQDRPIGNLKKEDFRVLEDLREQKVSVFKHEDVPLSLGLVIDNSRSIEPRKKRLDAAALSFVQRG